MSDELDTPNEDAAPVGDDLDGKPQAGTDDAPGGDVDEPSLSPEAARKLRSEANALRKRLKDAESKLTERETAELNEKQKLERDLTAATATRDQLEAEVRTLRAERIAAKIGIRADAVEMAVKALDWNAIEDPSDVKEIERALKELVKESPFLSSRPDGLDGGRGNGKPSNGDSLTDLLLRSTDRR